MKVTALAARMIGRRRRMMLRSAIPIGFAAFVFVLGASLLGTVRSQLLEKERTQLSGELAVHRVAGADSIEAIAPPTTPDVLVSHVWIAPAILGGPHPAIIAEVWFTDVAAELEFRNLQTDPIEQSDPARPAVSPSRTVGGSDVAPWLTESLDLSVPGYETIRTVSGSRVDLAENRMIVLVPWSELPEPQVTQPGTADRRPGAGVESVGVEVVRIRGVDRLDGNEVAGWAERMGAAPTNWEANASERMRDLWWLFAAVGGLLFIAGGVATAPSVGIVVRRHRAEFELLTATGYSSRYVTRLVAMIGAMGAAVTAAGGSLAAAIILSIASLRGGVDPSFLPLFWLEQNPALGPLLSAPPILPAAAAIVLAAVVGAVSALPASRVVATMRTQGTLWQ